MFKYLKTLYISSRKETVIILQNSFHKAFGKYILWTNIISSGALLGIGDIVQQEIEYRQNIIRKRYDYGRLGRMLLIGFALGPIHHYFYKYLDRLFPKQDLSAVTKKILADQFIASPLFISSFFYGMGLLEQKTLNEIAKELKDKFMIVYFTDWCVWPPTQFVNFYYLNPKYRVLYINMVTMFYDVFLSYIKHKDNEIDSQIVITNLSSKS